MKIKGVSRSEFNRLMAIPEAKEIYEAKMIQLKMLFKDRIEETGETGSGTVVRLPTGRRRPARKKKTDPGSAAQIVDASGYKREDEEDQVKRFLDYFENHPAVRQSVLENFYLKILPYTAVAIAPRAESG
jgi:hypothetical protein